MQKKKLILLGYVFKISQHKIKDVKFNSFYANNNVIIIWLTTNRSSVLLINIFLF